METAQAASEVKNGMTLLCPLLNVRHMGFDERHATKPLSGPLQAKCSFLLAEDNKTHEDAHHVCIQGP